VPNRPVARGTLTGYPGVARASEATAPLETAAPAPAATATSSICFEREPESHKQNESLGDSEDSTLHAHSPTTAGGNDS
jgi:hypothetical protein